MRVHVACIGLVLLTALSSCSAGRHLLEAKDTGTAAAAKPAPGYHCPVKSDGDHCPGCMNTANVSRADIRNAAKFVIQRLNELSRRKDAADVSLVNITEATMQLVAGNNYCLVLTVRNKDTRNTSGVYATVFRDLKGKYKLTTQKKFQLPLAAAPNPAPNGTGDVPDVTSPASPAPEPKLLQCLAAAGFCPGCDLPGRTTDADVVAAAAFAVQQLNSDKGWAASLVGIKQVTSQVVSGTKYCIVMTLQEPGAAAFDVLVNVWSVPWMKQYTLTLFQM